MDKAAALAMDGVRGVYTAEDIPGHNDIGAAIHDEELFATVSCHPVVTLWSHCSHLGSPGTPCRTGSHR